MTTLQSLSNHPDKLQSISSSSAVQTGGKARACRCAASVSGPNRHGLFQKKSKMAAASFSSNEMLEFQIVRKFIVLLSLPNFILVCSWIRCVNAECWYVLTHKRPSRHQTGEEMRVLSRLSRCERSKSNCLVLEEINQMHALSTSL
jgi:hypothetical protein